jgi:hypothetical protein
LSDIKVGDLAVIVRGNYCCNSSVNIGRLVRIAEIGGAPTNWCCGCCLAVNNPTDQARLEGWNGDGNGWIGIYRLKRIPPLDELERDQIVDELTCG